MKIAVITGASMGLGEEYSRQILEKFVYLDEIWLIARSIDKMQDFAALSAKLKPIAFDLTSDSYYNSITELFTKNNVEIDLLVNNAGCGDYNAFINSDLNKQLNMVNLNNNGILKTTHAALPFMKKGAKILNISSIASFVPNANMSVYSSTKAFVTSFSLATRYELKSKGINVTAVCPGPMNTPFLDTANLKGSPAFKKLPYCIPGKVVAQSLRQVKRNKALSINKFFYRLFRFLSKILPMSILIPIAKT